MPNRYPEILKDLRAKKNAAGGMAELIRWIGDLSRADFTETTNDLIAHADDVLEAIKEKPPEPKPEPAKPVVAAKAAFIANKHK